MTSFGHGITYEVVNYCSKCRLFVDKSVIFCSQCKKRVRYKRRNGGR